MTPFLATPSLAHLLIVVTGAMLGVAVLLAITRVVRGPSAVDRAVANEVVVSTLVCALGMEAALNRHSTTLAILLTLSLVGFLSSVAVARFAVRERDSLQVGHGDPPDEDADDTQIPDAQGDVLPEEQSRPDERIARRAEDVRE